MKLRGDAEPRTCASFSSQIALKHLRPSLDILSHEEYLSSLSLRCSNKSFPSLALVHSICAIGASICGVPPRLTTDWQSGVIPSSEFHSQRARAHLQRFSPDKLLDDVRAALILAVYSFTAQEMLEVWSLVGAACRFIAPSGLNVGHGTFSHLVRYSSLLLPCWAQRFESQYAVPPQPDGLGSFLQMEPLLEPATRDVDVFYRTNTMWQTYCCE